MQEIKRQNGDASFGVLNGSVYIGKTLGYAARKLGFWAKGYRVYRLRDESDRDGVMLAEDYELGRIIQGHPGLNRSRVAACEEYYGIRIFRVREGGH